VKVNQTTQSIVKRAQLNTVTVSPEISEADVIHIWPDQKNMYFAVLGNPISGTSVGCWLSRPRRNPWRRSRVSAPRVAV
jgi:hypothetical protein